MVLLEAPKQRRRNHPLRSSTTSMLVLWSPRLTRSPLEFRPVFLTGRRTTAPRSWQSRLGSTPSSRCQTTVPASPAVSLLSTTPLSPRKSRCTAELTPLHLWLAWRSLTLVPHRPSSGATYWIACSRWRHHPSRANGNALLDRGVVWRIYPSANFDERPPVRPTFSSR